MKLQIDDHPLLSLRTFVTKFSLPFGDSDSPPQLQSLLSIDADVPIKLDNEVRQKIYDSGRALLRHGGFKPAGRSKPAAEYLLKAANDGRLESINLAVNACNVVSLHSAMPISVVDLDRAAEPFRVKIAEAATSYVFNASGQIIEVGGLLCLFDADGPCANAVKDAQRTKTNDKTLRTLTLIWGHKDWSNHATATEKWYREILAEHGALTTELE